MNKMYPFEWLDSLILHTFNPHENNSSELSESDLVQISVSIVKEFKKTQVRIKNEMFSIRKKRQIRLLVKQYHTNLVYLLDRSIENQKGQNLRIPKLRTVTDSIINTVEKLLSFVEDRFYTYLSLDERVPITYLMVSGNELSFKIEKLRTAYTAKDCHFEALDVVFLKISEGMASPSGSKITYRQIVYQKDLLNALEDLSTDESESTTFSKVDQILIGMNFNAAEYINYFIAEINAKITDCVLPQEQRTTLLFYQKEFKLLASNEKISFDSRQHHIKYVLENWFRDEIFYVENMIATGNIKKTVAISDKIECILSTDQMALILRAGDESRVLKARSMSQVFKRIVPYLSTAQKKDLSYDAMRSKSYTAEDRDKEIAIRILERIIKHIRTF